MTWQCPPLEAIGNMFVTGTRYFLETTIVREHPILGRMHLDVRFVRQVPIGNVPTYVGAMDEHECPDCGEGVATVGPCDSCAVVNEVYQRIAR